MLKTRVTNLFGIEYPIIQGGLYRISDADFAAAVSKAGGLGIISSAMFEDSERLREEIKKTKKLTDKPFGVNIPLLPAELPLDIDSLIEVMIEEGVDILETAGRNPEPYMEKVKKNGIKIMHKVPSARFAQKAEKIGCDAIVVVGCECGGHPGEEDLSSLVLIRSALKKISIPLIAAGGFVDGRGLLAAISLGAEGVLLGTRFMLSQEASIHDNIKEHLVQLKETDTMYVLRSFNNTTRVIKNEVAHQVLQMEAKGAKIEEVLPLVSGKKGKELMETGNINAGILPCGQAVGLIEDISSVEDIIKNMVNQAIELRESLFRVNK